MITISRYTDTHKPVSFFNYFSLFLTAIMRGEL